LVGLIGNIGVSECVVGSKCWICWFGWQLEDNSLLSPKSKLQRKKHQIKLGP